MNWSVTPDPVLDVGPEGDWDDEDVETPTVIFNQEIQQFEMWYSGRGDIAGMESMYQIGHAWSDDGVTWTRSSENPVVPLEDADFIVSVEPTVVYLKDSSRECPKLS